MARPARPWFRFYTEAFSDRKLLRLTPEQRWLWVSILGAARESPRPGFLLVHAAEPMTAAEIARYADVPIEAVWPALECMRHYGMVEWDDDGLISVCNWDARQFESDNTAVRTAKHRSKERSKEQPNPVPGNTPETDTDTETDTENRTLVELALDDTPPVRDVFDLWRAECKHPRAVLDDKRRRRILWALRHYPPEDVADAIRGASVSEFHQGRNDDGRRYDDLTLILRDATHLERFRDEWRNGRARPTPKSWGALERMAKDGRIV